MNLEEIMKKVVLLVFVLALTFGLCACGEPSDLPDAENDSGGDSTSGVTVTCKHTWEAATCTEPKSCSKCGETSGVALGHTTTTGKCTRCGENFSAWEIGEYVDEFKQPTGNKYMVVDSVGVFSNSVTSNSTLNAAVQIDKNNIGIMLWEYGRNLVKGTFDYERYNITILDENGRKHYYTGTIYEGGSRVYFDDDDRNEVLTLMRQNDTLKIYLESTKYSISTYLFTIETKGFTETYKSIS